MKQIIFLCALVTFTILIIIPASAISYGPNFVPTFTSANTSDVAGSYLYSDQYWANIPDYAPWHAGDHIIGNDASGYIGASNTYPHWLRLDMASGHCAGKYSIANVVLSAAPWFPTAWSFQGSNDGSTWTTLDTQTGQLWNSSVGDIKSYTFSNSGNYTSYRLYFTAGSGSAPAVDELEIYEATDTIVANFTNVTPLDGISPHEVSFTDTSLYNPTSWIWMIKNDTGWSGGNGTWLNVNFTQNATITFPVGNWDVRLNASNSCGFNISTTILGVNSTISPLPTASFTSSNTSGAIPLLVVCNDTSTGSPDLWNWSVYDGSLHWYNYTTRTNLSYTFESVGTGMINLSVQNVTTASPISTASTTIYANDTVVADFTGDPTSGFAQLVVNFTDTSTGSELYYHYWQFGDGSTSTETNVSHNYVNAGTYTVNLTVTGPDGTSTKSVPDYITVTNSTDFNPYSTLQFKPGANIINNQTTFNRTVQLVNVSSASFLTGTTYYPQQYISVMHVYANTSTYNDTSVSNYTIDNTNGIVTFNVSRSSGFVSGTTPVSLVDIEMVQTGYTTGNTSSVPAWGSGYLGNATYNIVNPVTYYSEIPLTYGQWKTYSNFTANNTHPVITHDTVVFTSEYLSNITANAWIWNFGDGTIVNDTTGLPVSHIYTNISSNTTLPVTLTAYLSQNTSVTNTTTLYIYPQLYTGYVRADFTGSPTSGSVGLNVAFTDNSKWGASADSSARVYNWSFGDDGYSIAPYSSVNGSVTHVYSNLGTYTVTLTVSNTYNSSTMTKTNYIIISNTQNYAVTYPPVNVRLKVQTLLGTPITGATITAAPYLTATGSYNYVASLYGYQLDLVPLNNLTLSGTTDTLGDLDLVMMQGVTYAVNTSATGYTFSNPLTITADYTQFIIQPTGQGSAFVTNGTTPSSTVLFRTAWSRENLTTAIIWVNMTDTSYTTQYGTINIFKTNTTLGYAYNNVSDNFVLASSTFVGSSEQQGFLVMDYPTAGACAGFTTGVYYYPSMTVYQCYNSSTPAVNDASYLVNGQAITSSGVVTQTGTIWFQNISIPITGLSAQLALFLALFIMMFTAMMATGTTAPALSIAFCFEGWVFYGCNMLYLIDSQIYTIEGTATGITAVPTVLTVATVIAFAYNFAEYRRRNK